MKKIFFFLLAVIGMQQLRAATDTTFITPFEKSNGKRSATYAEVLAFYKRLRNAYPEQVTMGDAGPTDNGYPLRTITYMSDTGNPANKVTLLINNDIHPGEPDGVDACMMLIRDAAMGRMKVPANIRLVVIPVYNIGGALNRGSYSRANQNGPESYGFRGNARNLDLNRDFMKCDAAETIGLEELMLRTNPDLFIDNHVSDGADYQHIMTLLATQHDKLGGAVGDYMYQTFTPAVYKEMKARGYDLVPYVNDFDKTPDNGWREFFETPRFGSGFAALFRMLAYVPETHMLKPFNERVNATYALMQTFIKLAAEHAAEIKEVREKDKVALLSQKEFPLEWRVDTTVYDSVLFKGYTAAYKPSEVSGQPRLWYDHKKPYTKYVPFYDHYVPTRTVTAPKAYIIPKAWTPAITLLRANGVRMLRFNYDSVMTVTTYHIDDYETVPKPYERHYLHKNIKVTAKEERIQLSEGDYLVYLNQPAKRYIIEALEPTSPDGFFAWNFFDGILQEKEYYSHYVFEDIAADLLKKDPALKAELDAKRQADPEFAQDGAAQLDWVYKHSPYFEPTYLRYPVYRLEATK